MKLAILKLFILSCFNISVYAQWVQTAGTPEGSGITDMVICPNGNIVVTCASYNFPNGQLGGMRHSTDGGNSWITDNNFYIARTLALGQNGYLYASAWNYPSETEALWRSTTNGNSFEGSIYHVGAGNNIFSILVTNNNQTLYIGTRTGVRKSTNGGFDFTPVNNGIPANSWVRDIASDSNGIIAAATTNGVFISTNSAASWVQATGIAAGDTVVRLFIDYDVELSSSGGNPNLIAGTESGKLYESSFGAFTSFALEFIFGMTEISDIDIENSRNEGPKIMSVLTVEHNSQLTGFNVSTNNGTNWNQFNGGIPQLAALSAMAFGAFNTGILVIYLGTMENTTNGAKVYRLEMPIGIQQISSEIPNNFSLSQNYPNPFNPMTKIKFDIKKASNVSITVFDVLGRHISTLVNEKLNAGSYETEWNAVNMPGGVYFYKLETEDFSETKKMMLVK